MAALLHTVLGLLAFVATVSHAAPIVPDDKPALEARATGLFCAAVSVLVTKFKEQAAATSYCSSFLSIPVATVTSTTTSISTSISTSTTISPTTVTASTTITIPATTVTTTTITTTSTTFSLSTISTDTVTVTQDFSQCVNPYAPTVAKRAALTTPKAAPVPKCLSTYAAQAKSLVTSACRCLSIPTSTATATATARSVATSVTTQIIIATSTITPSITSTSTSTQTVTETAFITTESDVVATVTTTVVTGTFQMVATGDATIAGSYATHTAFPQYYVGSNLYFGATEADGDRFTIDDSGGLIDQSGLVVGNFADTGAGAGPNYVFVNPLSTIQANRFTQVICTKAVNTDGTCPITCSANGDSLNSDGNAPSTGSASRNGPNGCGNGYWALKSAGADSCPVFTILGVN